MTRCRLRPGEAMKSMKKLCYAGVLACAVLYAAIGVFGVVALSAKPSTATLTEGYGVTDGGVMGGHGVIADAADDTVER